MSRLAIAVSAAILLTGSVHADETIGGGGAQAGKNWNCTGTSCGAAGNAWCPDGSIRCCCPTGNPPTWAAACIAGGDCGGASNCDQCM